MREDMGKLSDNMADFRVAKKSMGKMAKRGKRRSKRY